MSAGDDDHDDDAQLKQLRAVWVSMRDEDPPDRGLAALMSAAREKAAELEQAAKPSWWQSVLATLRRPQVLALATVTILLGGALFVTQSRSRMKVEETVSTNDVSQPKGGSYGEASSGDSRNPGASAPSAGSAAAVSVDNIDTAGTVDQGATKQDATKSAEVVTESRPRDAKQPPKAATKSRPTVPAKPPSEDPPMQKDNASPDPGDAVVAGPRGAGHGVAPSLSIAQDDAPEPSPAQRDEAATVKSPPKKPIARTPPPTIEGEDRYVDKGTPKVPPTIDQLVKQCETAAARGDCTAVRAIAKKIQASSPTAYKSRVANNADITRCLTP